MLRTTHFSSQYFQLIDAVSSGERITVECPSERVAISIRLHFYKFRVALRKEGNTALADKADAILARLDGATLRFENRDMTDEAGLLAQALARNGH